MTVSWRKDKQNPGRYIVFGPMEEVVPNTTVMVTTKAGKSQAVLITRTSQPFSVDGEPHVFGYFD